MTGSGRFVGKFWSLVLAVVALNRALSYYERPPSGDTAVLEGFLSYGHWAAILTVLALLLVAGVILDVKPVKLLAHILLAACFATFAASIIASAVANGTGWSGSGTAAVVVLLHLERVSTLLHTIFGGRERE